MKLATKWWPFFRAAGSIPATIGERIECLSPYPIDLYQIHQRFSLSSVKRQMDAMADLVEAGKIRSVGVSNFTAAGMEEAHRALAARGIPLVSNQVRISLLDRSIERNGLLEAARRLGVTLIAYSPLAQGILSGRFHENPEAIGSVKAMRRMSGSIKPETIAKTAPLVAELKRGGRPPRRLREPGGPQLARQPLGRYRPGHPRRLQALPGGGGRGRDEVQPRPGRAGFDRRHFEGAVAGRTRRPIPFQRL